MRGREREGGMHTLTGIMWDIGDSVKQSVGGEGLQ